MGLTQVKTHVVVCVNVGSCVCVYGVFGVAGKQRNKLLKVDGFDDISARSVLVMGLLTAAFIVALL